eukprot:4992153-Alexandrium_andersonii.AAC.2
MRTPPSATLRIGAAAGRSSNPAASQRLAPRRRPCHKMPTATTSGQGDNATLEPSHRTAPIPRHN